MSRKDDTPDAPGWTRGTAPIAWLALAALGLALYAGCFAIGLVGDDFLFLDAAVRFPLRELLLGQHGIVGFYRPLSRELYFWLWGRTIGLDALALHLLNALTFVAIVALLARVATRFAGPRAGGLAALLFVLFPACGVLLAWVSCAQDLIALFWTVAALVFYLDGRSWAAGGAVLAAALSKETAVVAPAFLVAAEWFRPSAPTLGARARRLVPVAIGFGVALAITLAARSTWPAGTSVAVWSPAQAIGAWKLPWLFVRSLLPPDALPGLGTIGRTAPMLLLLVVAAAALAVPAGSVAPAPRRARTAAKAAPIQREVAALIGLGVAMWAIGLLPVAFILDRWRSYFFGFAALGSSLALAGVLLRTPAVVTRLVAAGLALVHVGANASYRPLPDVQGPARHAYANIAFFRDASTATQPMLQSLHAWCDSIAAVPRTFVGGVPPDAVYQTVFGAGLRATCRNPNVAVHFLAEFTPEDARTSFGMLRRDGRTGQFVFERANPETRARVGEGFLLYARYDLAAACFETAVAGAPDEPELTYPLACALAAAGRAPEAETKWRTAAARGLTPAASVFAGRLVSAGPPLAPERSAAALAELEPLVEAALREPWRAEPHRALGRSLLGLERTRPAVFELATAAGTSHEGQDLGWLGEAYEAMGAVDEARVVYRSALALGMPIPLHDQIFRRFMKLGPNAPPQPSAAPNQLPSFGTMPEKH